MGMETSKEKLQPEVPLDMVACVCKQWRSLTHDHRFIYEHRGLGAPDRCHLVSMHMPAEPKHSISMYDVGPNHGGFERRCLHIELNGEEPYGDLSNAVNGLIAGLFIVDGTTLEAYLINPTTRDHVQVPGGRCDQAVDWPLPMLGLGFDASRGVYKLVSFRKSRDEDESCECMVLTVGAGGWRCVVLPRAPLKVHRRPVFHDGALYWLANTGDTWESVLAFDVKDEEFRWIDTPRPPAGFFDRLRLKYLWEIEGHVCFVECTVLFWNVKTAIIWKLEGQPSHECWTPVHALWLNEIRGEELCVLDIRGGKAILQTEDAFWSYDLRNKTSSMLSRCNECLDQNLVGITPSLLSPTALVGGEF